MHAQGTYCACVKLQQWEINSFWKFESQQKFSSDPNECARSRKLTHVRFSIRLFCFDSPLPLVGMGQRPYVFLLGSPGPIVAHLSSTPHGPFSRWFLDITLRAPNTCWVYLCLTNCFLLCKGGFTRQSNAGDGYLQSANDGGNIQHHAACSISLIEDGACCIFAGKNRQLKFHRTLYPNYHFKEQKCFFYINNYYHCFRQIFWTILHWHWHAFSWPLAPASNNGKIIIFLPSMCEWSRYRRLHVIARLLVVITSFCPSCEAALSRLGTQHPPRRVTTHFNSIYPHIYPLHPFSFHLYQVELEFNPSFFLLKYLLKLRLFEQTSPLGKSQLY